MLMPLCGLVRQQSKQTRKRYDTYDSDDAASETSSVCSERSSASHVGRTSEVAVTMFIIIMLLCLYL